MFISNSNSELSDKPEALNIEDAEKLFTEPEKPLPSTSTGIFAQSKMKDKRSSSNIALKIDQLEKELKFYKTAYSKSLPIMQLANTNEFFETNGLDKGIEFKAFNINRGTVSETCTTYEAPPPYVHDIELCPVTPYILHSYDETVRVHPAANSLISENQYNQSVFSNISIRNIFIRKMYLVLSLQLILIFGFTFLCLYNQDLNEFVIQDLVMLLSALIVFMTVYMLLLCNLKARKSFPLNHLLLILLTSSFGYLTGASAVIYKTQIPLYFLGTAGLVCFLISIASFQTRFNILSSSSMFWMLGLALGIFGGTILVFKFSVENLVGIFYSLLATLFYIMYLLYDTQLILKGRRIEVNEKEYICGVLTLYTDITYGCINCLEALSMSNRDDY